MLRTAYLDRWLAASILVAIAGAIAPVQAHEAGPAYVYPERVIDEPGTGNPPLPSGQDGDGIADTNETVDLFVRLSNKSGAQLTNVVVHLATTGSKVACITASVVAFGNLHAGARASAPAPFRFQVAPTADRGGTVPPGSCTANQCSNGAGRCTIASKCTHGLLSALRSDGAFGGETCLSSGYDSTMPASGDGFYYLARGTEPWCAEPPTWRTYHPAENPGDPTKRDREVTCPSP